MGLKVIYSEYFSQYIDAKFGSATDHSTWPYVWPLWGSALSFSVFQHLAKIILSVVASIEIVGLFSIAKGIIEQINALYQQLPKALIPALSERKAEQPEKELNETLVFFYRITCACSLFICTGLAFFSPQIIWVITGETQATLAFLLSLLSLQLLFRIPLSSVTIFYFIYNQTTYILWSNALRMFAALILFALLIPPYQAIGAVAAESLAFIPVLVLFFWHIPKTFDLNRRAFTNNFWKLLLSSSVLCIVYMFLPKNTSLEGLILQAAAWLLSTPLIIRLTNLLYREDLIKINQTHFSFRLLNLAKSGFIRYLSLYYGKLA